MDRRRRRTRRRRTKKKKKRKERKKGSVLSKSLRILRINKRKKTNLKFFIF